MNPPSVEALLHEVEPLRRLARALAGDPHGAEDLVQDTLVVGLRRGPEDSGGLRPWLGRVARNLSARARRAEARRRGRERTAARRESVASTTELVGRAERQRSVVDAVLALSEPNKSTVLLRYWDGLPPRRIAAHQGVPVATVRTRLQRACEQLRRALDSEWGDRRAWSGFLLSWLARTRPPLGWTPAAAAVATLTIGVALAATAATLPTGAPGQPSVEHAAAPPVEQAALIAAPPTRPAMRRTAVAVRPQDPTPPPPRSVRVRTVDAHGEPIAGAEVHVWPSPWDFGGLPTDKEELKDLLLAAMRGGVPEKPMPDAPWVERTTDRGGACELPFPTEPSRLEVRGPGQETSGWIAFEPRGLRETPELTVVLYPSFALEGVVLDADGRPAADVTLSVAIVGGRAGHTVQTPPQPTTDARGRFAVRCDAFGKYNVSLRGAPYSAEQYRFDATPGGRASITLRLVGAASVRGVVRDAAGRPVEGAWVWAWRSEPGPGEDPSTRHRFVGSSEGGEPGAFVLKLPGPDSYDVHAQLPGQPPSPAKTVVLTAESPHGNTDLTLARPTALEGLAIDSSGRPLAEVPITACVAGTAGEPARCVRSVTDQRGRFRFADLDAGETYDLKTATEPTAELRGVRPGTPGVVLRPDPTAVARELTVLEAATGRAITGYEYAIAQHAGDRTTIDPRVEVTEGDGATRLRAIASDSAFTVLVWAEGFAPALVRCNSDHGAEVRVLLQRPAVVRVHVLDPAGEPAFLSKIRATGGTPGWAVLMGAGPREAKTDRLGRATLELAPGTYTLHAERGELRAESGDLVVEAAADRDVTLRLEPPK